MVAMRANASAHIGAQVVTYVLINVVEATIAGDEGGDLLAVLDELHTGALTDSGVGLLGLNTDLLNDNTLGHGGSTEGVGLHGGDGVGLLVVLQSKQARYLSVIFQ